MRPPVQNDDPYPSMRGAELPQRVRARKPAGVYTNFSAGVVLLLITEEWVQETHQAFLIMIRSHWCGWNIVLFEDRGSPHTAGESLRLAGELHIKLRFLPKATPELNAMDHLWRHVKGRGLANRATQSIDESADSACRYILDMSRRERLRKAGVLSGNFWLTKGLFCQRTF